MSYIQKIVILGVLALNVGSVCAAGFPFFSGGFRIASEILVSPLGGSVKGSTSSATESRKKARASANEAPSVPVEKVIVIVPEEEDGVLSPSRMRSPSDNRAKARDYSRGVEPGGSTTIKILSDGELDSTEVNRSNLENNRNKARRYSEKGTSASGKSGTFVKIGTSVGVVGPDGVVVFVCDDVNNVAGRIGDDVQSGNSLSVFIDGKAVRARCK